MWYHPQLSRKTEHWQFHFRCASAPSVTRDASLGYYKPPFSIFKMGGMNRCYQESFQFWKFLFVFFFKYYIRTASKWIKIWGNIIVWMTQIILLSSPPNIKYFLILFIIQCCVYLFFFLKEGLTFSRASALGKATATTLHFMLAPIFSKLLIASEEHHKLQLFLATTKWKKSFKYSLANRPIYQVALI